VSPGTPSLFRPASLQMQWEALVRHANHLDIINHHLTLNLRSTIHRYRQRSWT